VVRGRWRYLCDGLILESIQDADGFADAVDRVHAAGKSLVMLKVGRSAAGARATLGAHRRLIRMTTPSRDLPTGTVSLSSGLRGADATLRHLP